MKQASGSTLLTAGKKGGPGIRLLTFVLVLFASLSVSAALAQEARNDVRVDAPAGIPDTDTSNNAASDSDPITRSLTVRKVVMPAGDSGQFIMSANGTNGAAGGTGAQAVNLTVQAGQTVSFGEAANAGTSLANYSSNYRCASVDSAGAEIAELKTGATSSGDVVMPSANVVCTITNTRRSATLTLVKTWTNGKQNDQIALTVVRGATELDRLISTAAGGAAQTDTDTTPTTVYAGDSLTVAESFNQGAPANYTSAISCQGVNATNGSYTVDPADSAITCTATNERRSTLFSITKTWTNPRSGDSATIAPTTGLANNTAELVVAAATDASTAQVTVFAGEVATLPAETMTPAGALANYTTSVSCSGAGSTLTGTNGQAAGNTVAFSGSVSPTTPVSCTYRNERTPVQMTLRKQWTGADIGDAASITVTRNAGVIRTFTPAAGMTTELDVDFAFQVFSGDTLTLAETVSGNGTYDQQLLCSGAADSDPSDGLLVTPADTSIICTYTNTGAARVRVAKTTLGGVGTFTFAGDNGYAGDTITTTAAGATVNGTRDALAVNNTVTTITEDAPGAGWALTAINCAGLPAGGTFTPNLGSRSVELNAAATAPGANVTCTFTNSRLPTITVSKTSQGGVDAFTFTGNNGYDGDSITTVTAGTPVAAATQTLDAANAATFVAESAPPPGWALTGINCTGLPAGGTATYDLATRRVDLNAAATAPGAAVSCAFTNVRLPTITISKVSQGGVDTFGFTGSNGYDGDSIATVTAGTPVAAPTQTLDVAGNATFFTEASLPAGWSLTGIECTGIPTGSATYNTATRRVDLTAAATVAGAAIACTFTNSRLPTITVSKRTLGGAGSFGFSGSNGYDGDSITTVTAGTPVAAATQTLDVAGAITTITEAAPPAGWGLTGINCSGVPVGSATPNLATRSVQLNAAATAAGATISCEFVNAKRPTLQIVKVARDNAGGESFSFSGNNGFGSDSLVVTADGTSNGVVKVLSSGIDTTITEAASGFYLESIACRDQSGSIAVVPDLASRSVTVPGANLLPGAEVVCTFTNVSPRPSLSLEKSILNSGDATEVGDEINYRYVVSNDGNVPLTGVTLSDDKIPNAGDFSCDSAMPATIPVNGQVICTANYATTQADFDLGSVTNNARATDDAGVTDADNATETLIRTPRLTLVKSAAPATYDSLGDIINYTYLVTNSGNVTVSAPITITDDKIPSASIVCDAIADGELSPAAPGATPATAAESVTCRASYTIVQADLDNGSIVNTASAASDEGVVSNEDDATVTASQNAGISVVKTKQDNSFNAAGQPLDYAYVVTNTGNVTLTDVQLVDDKIATLNCTPALPATLAPGGLINCTAVYTTQQGDVNAGSVTNVATVTASPPTGPAVTDTDTQTVTAVQDASLALVKEIVAPIPTLFNVGEILHYRYTITNDGNVTLKQPFAVNDNLIDDVSCPATPAQLLPTQTIQCTASYTITADDVGNTGVVTNAASASGLDLNDGPVTSNNDTESFPIGATPILGITKVGAPGTYDAVNQTITYTYEVSNRGNVGIAGPIVVHDDKLGSIECLAAGNFLPAADPDASVQCTATHATTQADLNEGEIENEAFATGRAGGQTVTSNTVQEIVEADQNPQLAVVKSVPSLPFNDANGNGRPDAGETVTYTITVTNNGNVRLTILEVDDPAIGVANAGLTTVPIYSDNDNDPTTLDPGESGFVTRTYTLLQSDIDNGEKLNTATASATAPDGSYVEQDGSKDVDLPPSSALTLDKQGILVTSVVAPNGRVDVGDRIDYTFLVTNTGNVTLSDLVVNDPPLAPAVTVSCPATTLAPGASTTCTASRTLNQADLDAGQVVNTAQAAASLPDDDEVSSNPDSVTVTLPAAASIAVDKVAGAIVDGDGNGHDAGDTISYSFTVSNTGNTTLTNVRISDPKLGLSDVPVTPATLAPGATGAYGPQVYTLTQADIDAGTVNNTATAAGAPPTGADVTGADSTATPITRAPALTLVKAAVSPAAFDAAGDTIDYTYRVTNSGNTTLTAAVSVNDDKIASVNCPAMPGGGLQPGQFIECTGTYTVSQQDVDAGSVVNLARAQSGPTQSNQASETVDGNGQPAMTLIKTAAVGSSFDAAGDTIIYNYEVTNTGDLTLYGPITIADDKINGAAPQGTVSCPAIPSSGLAPDETLLCTGTYIVTQPDVNAGQVENVARASSSDPRDPSGDAVESNADNEIVTGERNPSLTVVKTQVGGPDPVTGLPATLEYEVVVDNTGNVDLTGVTPSDALTNGAGTALALTSGLTLISGDANNDSVLNVNETWTYAGTYVVTQADLNAGGNLTNVASVETDQTPAAVASDPVVTPVTPPASLTVVKTQVGGPDPVTGLPATLEYEVVVDNTGNVDLTGVTPSDALTNGAGTALALTSGLTLISGDANNDSVLNVNETWTYAGTYVVTQADLNAGGNLTNVASVETDQTPAAVASDPVVTPVTPPASLTVVKTQVGGPDPVTGLPATLEYEVVVDNTGNVDLTGVTPSDALTNGAGTALALTSGLTLISGDANNDSVLNVNETWTYAGTYVVTQADLNAGGNLTNVASVETDQTPAAVASDPVVTPVTPPASLTVVKTQVGGPDPVTGLPATLEYEVVVDNTGNVDLTGVTPSDALTNGAGTALALTSGLTLISGDANNDSVLNVNETWTYAGTYVVTQADLNAGGNLTNVASVETDQTPAAVASDPVVTPVTPPASLTVVKTQVGGPDPVTGLPATLEYEVVVDNTGNVDLTGVTPSDALTNGAGTALALTSGLTLISGDANNDSVLNVNETWTYAGTYVVTQADLNAGGNLTNVASVETDQTPAAVASDPVVTPVTPPASLTVVKTQVGGPDPVTGLPATLEYEVVVDNTGNVDLTGVTPSDALTNGAGTALALTSGLTLISGDANNDSVLNVNETWTYAGTYVVTQADLNAGGNLTNVASVETDQTPAAVASDPVVTPVTPPASLTVVKTQVGGPDPVTGLPATLEYEVVVDNTGNVDLTGVTPSDALTNGAGTALALTSGLTLISGDANNDSVLNVNETWTYAGTYVVTQADLNAGGNLTNVASVETDQTPAAVASDPVVTPVTPPASLTVVKTQVGGPDPVTGLPATLEYEVVVDNTGNVDLTGVTPSDALTNGAGTALALTSGLTLISGDANNDSVLNVNETWTYAGTYVVTQADLNAGGNLTNVASVETDQTPAAVASDPVVTPVTPPASLTVVKTQVGGPDPVTGLPATLEYEVVVDNTGNVDLTGVTPSDALTNGAGTALALTSGLTLISGDANNDSVLNVNETWTYAGTYVVTQADLNAGGNLTNVASVETDQTPAAVASDPVVTPVTPPASLTVVKTQVGGPDPVTGLPATLEYEVVVDNTGNVDLTGVTPSDALTNGAGTALALTSGLTLISGDANNDSVLNVNETWTYAGTYVVTQADLNAGGNLTNVASVETDQTPAAVASDPVVTPVTPPASLTVVKTQVGGPDPVTGLPATLEYEVVVDNTGNVDLTGVTPSDALTNGAGTALALTSGLTLISGDANNDSVLNVNETWTYAGTYVVTQADLNAGGNLTNVASVETDQTPAAVASDPVVTPVTPPASLTVVKTQVGGPDPVTGLPATLEYEVVVDNTGNVDLTGVTPSDALTNGAGTALALTSGLTLISGDANNDSVLNVNETWTYAGTYVVTQADLNAGGNLTNVASVETDQTPAAVASDPVVTPVTPPASLTVVKTQVGGPDPVTGLPATLEYEVVVDNTGNVDLTGVTPSDALTNGAGTALALTSGLTLISGDANNDSVLNVNETWTYAGTYVVTQADLNAGGNLTNVASVETDQTPAAVASDPVVTPVTPPASLTVVKTQVGGPDPVTGLPATLEYEVVVDNTGNVDLTGVTPSDALTNGAGTALALTSGLTLISGDANNDSVLNVNETWTYAGTYVVTQADLNAGGNLTNVASVETDQTPAAVASDPVVTPVTPPASISITKVATLNGTGAVNDTISYAFTVTNTGNVPLTDVSVSDALPGIVVDGGPLALLDVGASDATTFTATYTIRQTDVTAGNVTNSATVTGTPPVGPDVTDASDDPANPANVDPNNDGNPDDPTVVALPQTPQIGVAKAASAPVLNADGTFDVIYTINVENTGNVELSDLQLQDDLTSPDQLGSSFVSVRAPPQVVLINVSGQAVEPTANPAYAGTAANPDLLAGTDGLLMPGDGYRVTFTVTINPYVAGAPAVFANIATASGATVGGMRVSDLSNNGSDPGNQPGGPGSPTIVVPPAAPAADVTLTKTASVRLAKRGDVIAYTITVQNNRPAPTGEISVIDNLPAGFIYVEGSAELDGVAVTPVVSGNRVQVDGVSIPGNGKAVITIRVKISTSVEPGDHTNVADAIDPATGNAVAVRAKATVRISIEHVFDCGEIIGKVFDDANRNGYQDDGERGMPGVRLATVRGVLITTDRHGRFSVPCADIPDARIGSNFLLKLDTRTLPTGYRLTTENPRDVRLTAGKVTKLNFGVAIDRVVRIDLNNAAFAAGSVEPSRKLRDGIAKLIKTLDREHSVVRLTYYATAADEKLAQKRLKTVSDLLTRAWREARGSYELGIETKVIRK